VSMPLTITPTPDIGLPASSRTIPVTVTVLSDDAEGCERCAEGAGAAVPDPDFVAEGFGGSCGFDRASKAKAVSAVAKANVANTPAVKRRNEEQRFRKVECRA